MQAKKALQTLPEGLSPLPLTTVARFSTQTTIYLLFFPFIFFFNPDGDKEQEVSCPTISHPLPGKILPVQSLHGCLWSSRQTTGQQ